VFTSGNALAASTLNGGAICHDYAGSDAGSINYLSHGVFNKDPKSIKKVICPVTKLAKDYKGLKVRVNLDSLGPKTVSCTLYGSKADGSAMGAKTVPNQKTGFESLTLSLPTSTLTGYFSVVCALPPKQNSEIFSI
jgi:hypothetical protein